MSVLSRLKTMPDKEIQIWLRKVGRENVDSLAKALTAADADIQECVLRNMSMRAKSLLKEDIRKYQDKGYSDADIRNCAARLELLM
jgi:flagellar motor switch protein FliG